MPLEAVIFDVDGTLVDSERHGHLAACNRAFEELDLGFQWSWDEFRQMLVIPGNGARLRHYLKTRLAFSDDRIESIIQRFLPLKQRIYNEELVKTLPLRPGVRLLIDSIIRRGLRLAIVSTSHESQIRALLQHHFADIMDRFDPVLGKESGIKVGEEGWLYSRCLQEMRLPAENVIAIEDSRAGMEAALKAGLSVLVVRNEVTWNEDFSGADRVEDQFTGLSVRDLEAIVAERSSQAMNKPI